jgi:hypothetical protein
MFGKNLEQHLRGVIKEGNFEGYKSLLSLIVKIHRETFTEENLPTAEDAILECVNEALDRMWAKEHVTRDMAVYKTFLVGRDIPTPLIKPDTALLPSLNYCIMAGSGPTCTPLSRHECMGCHEFPQRKEAYRQRQENFQKFKEENG